MLLLFFSPESIQLLPTPATAVARAIHRAAGLFGMHIYLLHLLVLPNLIRFCGGDVEALEIQGPLLDEDGAAQMVDKVGFEFEFLILRVFFFVFSLH